MSYPLPLDETNRIEALYSYNILDTSPEVTFDSIARIASVICKTPISVISFSDKNREWFKSIIGLDFKEIPREISFCSYTILKNEIFIIEDTLLDTRFFNNPLVVNDPLIRFYAGVPLKSKDGYNLGALCVLDKIPRKLSQEQIELLIALSDQVIALIELKKYVVKLEDKKARLDILLENTDADIWSIDRNYKLVSFNSAFKKNFELGFKITPYIGLSLQRYIKVDHYLDWKKFYDKALQGEKFTTDYQTKNNESYNEVSFNPIIFNNQVTGVTIFSRDITEKKIKDLQIIESENKFKVAFDHSPIGMSLFSDQRKWIRLNKAFCDMIGYTEEELLNLTFEDITHPEDIETDKLYIKQIVDREITSYQREKRYIHKNGSIVWGKVHASLIVDNTGKVLYFIVQIQNITEKRADELKLLESENKFRNAFDYSPIGIILTSLEGRLLKINKAFCKMVGYSEEELLKLNFKDITHFEDIDDNLNYMKKLIKGETNSYKKEKRYIHKNGKIIWSTLDVSLVKDSNEQPMYFVAQIQDITDKKLDELKLLESENRFRSAFDYSAICAALVSLDTKFLSVNKAFCQMIGYSKDELLTMSFTQLTYPDDSLNTIHHYNDLLNNQITSYETEKRYIHKNGHLICLFISISAVYDNNGNIIYLLAQAQDITQRKENEKKLVFNSNILQNVQDSIMVTDVDGYITYWNQGVNLSLVITRMK